MSMPETPRPSTGRRKEASARVRLTPGTGTRTINDRTFQEYFRRPTLVSEVERPLALTNLGARYDVAASVRGGGTTGQAGAVRLGLARALIVIDPTLKPLLSREGMLRRDARIKERKKYGQPGARKRFQFSKR
jgi:small subunit ribosomal protein S9